MYKINQNDLAQRVAKLEGGKKNLSIAQIKEVLRIALEQLRKEIERGNIRGVLDLLRVK